VVHVTDSADVQVRLVAFKCFLCHINSPVLLKLNCVFFKKLSSLSRAQTGAHDRD
jgi:hypothetical protein